MAQVGGSATIYGILYQALGASHWASTISLKSDLENNELASAHLVIEPQGGGGDIVIATDERRIVEQWKAKNDHGTWSVRALVIEVFPDLLRAVDYTEMTQPVEYRFVSEGRTGRWKDLLRLFDKIHAAGATADPVSALDDTEHREFLPDSEMTEREFFSWMKETLRKHEDIAKDEVEVTGQKLWHLIANFRFCAEQTLEKVQAELDHLLLGAVDFREQVPGKRRELCGLLLELASQGEVKIATTEFLGRAQIKSESFEKWSKLQEKLLKEIAHRIRGEWQYLPEHDVRDAPAWPAHRPILILTGESGQGKTWQLGALAMKIVDTNGLVATTTASGAADRDLQSAANVIWQNVLGHDQGLSLERLAERYREISPKLENPWLTVCIDDVLWIEEARRLVSRDWDRLGARLAISTLPAIARSLQFQFGERVHVVEVEDFSLLEAQEHLRRSGHDWGRLPSDVREILKRPLLARLFVDIAAEGHWLPTHEYELFEKFWLRIREARNQADHPGDSAWMRRLAGTVLDESLQYPWPQSSLVDLGMLVEVQVRLESIGWLRRLDGDRVEIWHDRVLNWAVAEELVARRENETLSSQDLKEVVANLWGTSERRCGRYLGYVPLDVLWIIGNPSHVLREELPSLIEALEESAENHNYLEHLYGKSLPTLGERVIDGIVERVRSAPKGDANRYPHLAANAIVKIGLGNKEAAAQCGRELISDPDKDLQQVGMEVLATAPDPSTLDRLWELHQGLCTDKGSEDFGSWWPKYDRSFTALRSVVKQNPEWLKNQVDTADPKQAPVHELVYLLASLEGEAGRRIWREKKEVLFAKVPPNKLRCLARCIEHFRDDSEVERLEDWLKISEDLLAPTALMALSRIDPQRALNGLQVMDPTQLYTCRNWWLGQLAARCPGKTQSAIRQLMLDNPDSKWSFAEIYQGSLHLLDEETLRLLFDELRDLATARLENPKDTSINLFRPLMLLEDVTSSHLLRVFESYAVSDLEKHLVEVAKLRLDGATLYVDHELEGVSSVLLKINGMGLTELINAELRSKSKHSRLKGVERSLMRPDRTTRELLRTQFDCEECWDENGYPLVQSNAAVMLAALGENAAVVKNILRWKTVLRELSDVRRGMTPMTDVELTDALAAIDSGDDEQCTQGLWALSVSGRSDLAPVAVEVLRRADPTSELARSAVWALGDLECRTAEAVELIEPQLYIEDHKYAAIIALARMKTSEANVSLEHCLSKSGITPGHVHDDLLAVNLCRRSDYQATVAAVVWQTIQEHPDWGGQSELLDCLASLDDPAVKEWLLREAYEPDKAVRTVGRRAWIVRTLARFDDTAAYQACESALLSGAVDHDELAKALIELNSDRAIPVVCKVAAQRAKAAVRYSIGLALRQANQKEQVSAALMTLVQSDSASDRKVALELAGWVGVGCLPKSMLLAALDDYAIAVRVAACNALRCHAVEADAIELLTLLKDSHGARAWSLLDAILNSANPQALQTRGDPLFLGDAYPHNGVPYWIYCRGQLERRAKDIDKELGDMDRKED